MSLATTLGRVEYSDDQLYNFVIARGPGQGLERLQIIYRDVGSIAAYGERQYILDVPDAADATDLLGAAQQFVTGDLGYGWWVGPAGTTRPDSTGIDRSEPRLIAEAEVLFDIDEPPDIVRGDIVRLVSQEMNILIDEVVREIDWRETSATLFFGKDADNVVDLILDKLNETQPNFPLGLLTPFNFAVNTSLAGGISFNITSVSGSEDYYELATSQSDGFDPNTQPVRIRGYFTSGIFDAGSPGLTFYFRARRIDNVGNFSPWTGQRSAVFG